MKQGDAFWMFDASQSRHLYIVISDPAKNAGAFVIVNLTGDRFRTCQKCVLNVGDHPSITKASWVSFGDALETNAAKINKLIGKKKAKLVASLAPVVLGRIIGAAKISPALEENFKKYL